MTRDLLPVFWRRLVAIGVLAVANVALFAAALQPVAERRFSRDVVLARLEARLRALDAEERARTAVVVSWRQAEAYAAGFPARAELLAVTNRIQRAAEQLDVRVPAIDYRPAAKGTEESPLTRVAIAMSVEGPYREVRRFIYEMERQRRYLVIEKVSLRGRPGEGKIQLALELAAYFR